MLRTAVMLEQWCHNLFPHHSAVEWEMSDLLYLSNVSVDVRRMLSRMGLGMEPSHQGARVAMVISQYSEKVQMVLGDPGRVYMLIFDDFNGHWKLATPSEKKISALKPLWPTH